ncbi:hypothetical protein [Bradyrhizobium forestalis]|uniref:hypothetical protein n=1 Tax=Bradyrhizobium forestalis TaxID=1419263 RepID=UPI00142E5FDB|nr:hypothetical protein [Bradyrhizobium forestalis]
MFTLNRKGNQPAAAPRGAIRDCPIAKNIAIMLDGNVSVVAWFAGKKMHGSVFAPFCTPVGSFLEINISSRLRFCSADLAPGLMAPVGMTSGMPRADSGLVLAAREGSPASESLHCRCGSRMTEIGYATWHPPETGRNIGLSWTYTVLHRLLVSITPIAATPARKC